MKYLFALISLALGHSLAAAETAVPLLNEKLLSGWELVSSPAAEITRVCHFQPDGVLALDGKPTGYLHTTRAYTNYRLHAEWRWPAQPGNSGVLVHISSGPKDRAWPLCFQLQLKNKSAGDLLPMAGATFAEPLTPGVKTPARVRLAPDSENPAGEWNACDITCRNGTIDVTVNGVPQNRVTGCAPASGSIGFQFEGAPFELRHLTLVQSD